MKVVLIAMGGLESEVGFNKREISWSPQRTLKELLAEFGIAKDIMVSVNEELVLADAIATTRLHDGDAVRLLPPIAGG